MRLHTSRMLMGTVRIFGCPEACPWDHRLVAQAARSWRSAALVCGAVMLLAGPCAARASAADSVYWATLNNPGPIRTGDLVGGVSPSSLFPGESWSAGMAIDPAAGKIYWADSVSGAIRVGNLNGTGSPQNLFTGESGPLGVAIDPATGKIYWADGGAGTIRVGNLNGLGSPQNLFTGEGEAYSVAIDPLAGKIYWVDSIPGTVRVGNLNGLGSPHDLFTGQPGAGGLAIDSAAGKIYWADNAAGAIRVANLNGTGSPQNLFTGESAPQAVAIDAAAGKIYWDSTVAAGAIRVGNLNGTGSPQSLFTGESYPMFPVLLRVPAAAGAPEIVGDASVGAVLSCSRGQWARDLLGASLYRAPQTFRYGWTLDGAPLLGASSNTLTAGKAGTYTCQVTAANAAGSTIQTSAARTVSLPAISSLKAKITHHTAQFAFKGSAGTTGFRCSLVGLRTHGKRPKLRFRNCKSPKTYTHLKHGKYRFEVRPASTAGAGRPKVKTFTIH